MSRQLPAGFAKENMSPELPGTLLEVLGVCDRVGEKSQDGEDGQ